MKLRQTAVQAGATALAGILFVLGPYLDEYHNGIAVPLVLLGLALLIGSIVFFFIYPARHPEYCRELRFSGLRNLLFIPAAFIASKVIVVSWFSTAPVNSPNALEHIRQHFWNLEYLWYALGYCLAVTVIFGAAEHLIRKKTVN